MRASVVRTTSLAKFGKNKKAQRRPYSLEPAVAFEFWKRSGSISCCIDEHRSAGYIKQPPSFRLQCSIQTLHDGGNNN
jgi:hypothetical protein